ncbi:MAG TPA: hypothetical protein VH138_03410, partial [Vicinamibacterales bacterium]|nr:hypothetical protein [Vicinamibacterales bacterium]
MNARLAALQANANTATFQVTYDNTLNTWPANAIAAFQAAVNIWSTIITSPSNIPIKIIANFDSNFTSSSILGRAGPAGVCQIDSSNTLYAAALANVKNGNTACDGNFSGGVGPYQISAHFNSSFMNWDFGTTGTPGSGTYNFLTVVLHELAHGLGFYGSMTSSNGSGSHFYDTEGFTGFVDVFDHFVAVGGAGGPSIPTIPQGTTLHSYLIGNNLFFSGPNTNASNGNTAGKIESNNFSVAFPGHGDDHGWLQGSSYSHTDFISYNGTPNGLMAWQLPQSQVYTDPGPIVRGIFEDEGWTLSAAGCTYSLSPTSVTVGPTATSGSVMLTTQTNCGWTASSANTGIATITSATSGSGSATINYNVNANGAFAQRSVNLTIGGQTFAITQNGTGPTMTLDRSSLIFTGVNNGASFTAVTGSQTVRMTQTGAGTITWTASSNSPWLQVSPTSGTGSKTFTVSAHFTPGLFPTEAGSITINLTGAGNTAGPIGVTLNSISPAAPAPPFGSLDTPANNVTGVAGSLAVTGWALDDIQVARVTICRDAVTNETAPVDPNCANNSKIYIGDAIFVDGARTDVQAQFPTLPLNSRGGWGYLMLTNFLPNLGNGTFTLRAYAFDVDGHTTLLGSKTITCDNAHATKPFGAIDTPGQGAVVSGVISNGGWVLTQPGKDILADSSTITAFIDGVALKHLDPGRIARSDITTLFSPTYDTSHAAGGTAIDTTALTNGAHTIFWIVSDTGGNSDGIGSRFFTISNGSLFVDPGSSLAATDAKTMVIAAPSMLDMPRAASARLVSPETLNAEIAAAPSDLSPVQGRRGFDLETALQTYQPSSGRIDVQAEELDRVELHLSESSNHRYSGY